MKILIATSATKGAKPNDFCFCEEGEVVVPNVLANYEAFLGLKSRQSTTMAKVVDQYTFEELLDQIMFSEAEAGLAEDKDDPEHRLEWIDVMEKCLDRVAEFPVGTIMEIVPPTEHGLWKLEPRLIPEGVSV